MAAAKPPINPFRDTPAKMITAESSLTMVTYPMFYRTLDYATGTVFRTNNLLEIYVGLNDGNKPPYRSVWTRGKPRMSVKEISSLNIKTLHFRFRYDILDFKLLNKILKQSIFLYSITNFRRPGESVGSKSQQVNPTAKEFEQYVGETGDIILIANKASAAAEKAKAAAEVATTAAARAATLQRNAVAERGAPNVALPEPANDNEFVEIADEESTAMDRDDANKIIPYEIQNGISGKFYTDVLDLQNKSWRMETTNTVQLVRSVTAFAEKFGYTAVDKTNGGSR